MTLRNLFTWPWAKWRCEADIIDFYFRFSRQLVCVRVWSEELQLQICISVSDGTLNSSKFSLWKYLYIVVAFMISHFQKQIAPSYKWPGTGRKRMTRKQLLRKQERSSSIHINIIFFLWRDFLSHHHPFVVFPARFLWCFQAQEQFEVRMARLEVRFPAKNWGCESVNPNLLKAKFIRVWQIGGFIPKCEVLPDCILVLIVFYDQLPQSAFEIILLLHPWSFTWNLKINFWKASFSASTLNFWGCMFWEDFERGKT